VEYLFVLPAKLGLTRCVRWVSDYANVPRPVLRPSLLLDFAASDTQRTLLGVIVIVDLVFVFVIPPITLGVVIGACDRALG